MEITPEALRNNKMMNFSQKSENKHLFNPWSNMYKEGGGGGGVHAYCTYARLFVWVGALKSVFTLNVYRRVCGGCI